MARKPTAVSLGNAGEEKPAKPSRQPKSASGKITLEKKRPVKKPITEAKPELVEPDEIVEQMIEETPGVEEIEQTEQAGRTLEDAEAAYPVSAATKSEARRAPRAMTAPEASTASDYLDREHEFTGDETPTHLPVTQGGSRWLAILLASASALISLGLGLWFTRIIEDLFARHVWLGWGATVLLAITALALIVIIFREIAAIWRMKKLQRIRGDISRVLEGGGEAGNKPLRSLVALYNHRPDMDWHMNRLIAHNDQIMDDRDRLILAERYLMKPLDGEAKQVIASAARRVAIVTAVNPAASLDILFTGYQVLRMLRQLTQLYGSRPGSVGTLKLAGMVGSHLAVTGGLALSDAFLQQFLGKGIAGRLSAKLGEGTVNGIMTARIGIAALDLCRPMPFHDLERPGLGEFIKTVMGATGAEKNEARE